MAPRSDVDADVAVVGAGPAGLAAATFAARAGLSTVVCERSAGPPDKACGEGLMPAGLRVLTALGARELLGPEDCFPIEGIRYVEEDGAAITGRLPPGGGLGVRRTALAAALARTATGSGVEIRWGTTVTGFERRDDSIELKTSAGKLEGRILIAADGLHSPLRKSAGLDGPADPRERFGLRQHFRLPPWSRLVEVHLSPGVEAFVTPTGASRVGVAARKSWARSFPQPSGAAPPVTRWSPTSRLPPASSCATPWCAGPSWLSPGGRAFAARYWGSCATRRGSSNVSSLRRWPDVRPLTAWLPCPLTDTSIPSVETRSFERGALRFQEAASAGSVLPGGGE